MKKINDSEDARDLLVIIPAYNEAASLASLIQEVHTHLSGAHVLVIDDASKDETASVALREGATVVSLPYNLGIGGAVQTGLIYALRQGFSMAMQLDGDGQHPPQQAGKLLHALQEQGADVVCGSRYMEGRGDLSTPLRRMGIRIFSYSLHLLGGITITDPTSGFRLLGPRALALLAHNYATDYPEVEALLYMRRSHLRILEVPVSMRARMAGQSSITPLRSAYYMIKVLLSLLMERLRNTS